MKFIIPLIALAANFLIAWYGNFAGRHPNHGTYLGIPYDSIIVKSIIIQFQYLWILIIINFLFSVAFSYGFIAYKSFITLMFLWAASGPIAWLIYNAIVTKETINWIQIVGIILVTAGAFTILSHKELMTLLEGR